MDACEPLSWPFEWKALSPLDRFLVGTPFFGAQARADRHLRAQLRRRTSGCLELWGNGARRARAEELSGRLAKEFDWPNPLFIPDDPFGILCWDRRAYAVDDLRVPTVLRELGLPDEALKGSYAKVVDTPRPR